MRCTTAHLWLDLRRHHLHLLDLAVASGATCAALWLRQALSYARLGHLRLGVQRRTALHLPGT